MYIVSIFIAVINSLLNNHEKVNTSLAFIESQIFFTSSYFLEKIFQLQVMGPTLQSVTMDVFMN